MRLHDTLVANSEPAADDVEGFEGGEQVAAELEVESYGLGHYARLRADFAQASVNRLRWERAQYEKAVAQQEGIRDRARIIVRPLVGLMVGQAATAQEDLSLTTGASFEVPVASYASKLDSVAEAKTKEGVGAEPGEEAVTATPVNVVVTMQAKLTKTIDRHGNRNGATIGDLPEPGVSAEEWDDDLGVDVTAFLDITEVEPEFVKRVEREVERNEGAEGIDAKGGLITERYYIPAEISFTVPPTSDELRKLEKSRVYVEACEVDYADTYPVLVAAVAEHNRLVAEARAAEEAAEAQVAGLETDEDVSGEPDEETGAEADVEAEAAGDLGVSVIRPSYAS